jgi:hypothetical protein
VAGFKAHFSTAAVVGGVVATSLLSAGLIDSDALLLCFGAALLGGLLPDIDSDSSTILTVSFSIFALIFSFLVQFSLVGKLSTLELLLVWLGAFIFFKLVLFELFIRLTVHRGIFHSIPAAFLSLFFFTLILKNFTNLPNPTIWLVSSFIFLGFIIHLLLDELTSLNLLSGNGVKQSFGTALKLFSSNLPITALLYLVTVGFYLLSPDSDGLFQTLLHPETWQSVQTQFYPTGEWFQIQKDL